VDLSDFERTTVVRDDVALAVHAGGEGDPVVLLHGYPQSRLMWHRIAEPLSRHRRVVLVDLRGYGDSDAPAPLSGATNYAKREMAADVLHAMRVLGHDHFDVVGHDRGGRVAHRLALDHPSSVRSVAVLDIVPTLHMFEHVDRAMAETYFHWFFLARPDRIAERLIAADPESWVRSRFDGRHGGGEPIDPCSIAAYVDAFRRPGVIAATCADYRAAAGIDLEHDRLDRARERRVTAPLLALWGRTSYVGRHFDVADVWSQYAESVWAEAVDADHYLAEEAPAATLAALVDFWGSNR
jgi:haloacetate dehalogenase